MRPGNDTIWPIWIIGGILFLTVFYLWGRSGKHLIGLPEEHWRTRDRFWRIYVPQAMLVALGPLAFLWLFRAGFDSRMALFSNDGPLGYMASAHMVEAMVGGPNTPMWNDLWWLGQSSGEVPLSFSYFLMWIFCNPWALLATVSVLIGLAWLALHRHFASRPREICPECNLVRLRSEIYATVKGGRVCLTCLRSKLWPFKEPSKPR